MAVVVAFQIDVRNTFVNLRRCVASRHDEQSLHVKGWVNASAACPIINKYKDELGPNMLGWRLVAPRPRPCLVFDSDMTFPATPSRHSLVSKEEKGTHRNDCYATLSFTHIDSALSLYLGFCKCSGIRVMGSNNSTCCVVMRNKLRWKYPWQRDPNGRHHLQACPLFATTAATPSVPKTQLHRISDKGRVI
jgi:hypothetical protein